MGTPRPARAEILRLLSIFGAKLDPLDSLRYRGQVVEATRTAVRLNPTSAELHARLAEASAAISMYQDAADEAELGCVSPGTCLIPTQSSLQPSEIASRPNSPVGRRGARQDADQQGTLRPC